MDIRIKPFVGKYDSTPPRNFDLTWAVDEFENTEMKINLKFANPLEISMNPIYDNIVVKTSKYTNFKTFDGIKVLANMTTETQIPKQMIVDGKSATLVASA